MVKLDSTKICSIFSTYEKAIEYTRFKHKGRVFEIYHCIYTEYDTFIETLVSRFPASYSDTDEVSSFPIKN